MAIFNRVYCQNCKKGYNVYNDKLKEINCKHCGELIKINSKEANYFIEYYAFGKRKREKVGSSRTFAGAALGKRKVEIAENKFFDIKREEKIKFEDFSDEYFRLHSKVNNARSGREDFHNINMLKKFFAGKCLDEITPKQIEEFKAVRANEVSPASINRQLACLKSIFNKAIAWRKFLGTNPVKGVKLFRENNQRLRFLEKEEIGRLLACCPKHIKPLIVVALNTGMRRGEILGLKWSNVDLKRDIIYLLNTKNGEKREIPMNAYVKNALMSVPRDTEGELIFFTGNGRLFKDFRKSFFTALKKSDIKGFRFHDLRHTFASHLVMSGIDLNTVRELLGHKSIKMTLRYAHLSPHHKKAAVSVLTKMMDTIWTPENKFFKNEETICATNCSAVYR